MHKIMIPKCLVRIVSEMSLTCHEVSVLLRNFWKKRLLLTNIIGEYACVWHTRRWNGEKSGIFYFLVHSWAFCSKTSALSWQKNHAWRYVFLALTNISPTCRNFLSCQFLNRCNTKNNLQLCLGIYMICHAVMLARCFKLLKWSGKTATCRFFLILSHLSVACYGHKNEWAWTHTQKNLQRKCFSQEEKVLCRVDSSYSSIQGSTSTRK